MIEKIVRYLGSGHFGIVSLGIDSLHGEVAVKALKQTAGEDKAQWEARMRALRQEGARLMAASHDNVVRVLNIENDVDGNTLLVMELCQGGSLQAEYGEGPIQIKRVRDIATAVSQGLRTIHARGMLHRDIKPANILCDAKGHVKIGDFGLVTDELIYGYARSGSTAYGPHLAKEVWEGRGTSQRSDVWAFGMTVYRLLHGECWYEAMIPDISYIAKGKFADRLGWLPHIPRKWRRFVRKCLHDNTDVRYQSADQVLCALAELPVAPAWTCTVHEGTGASWQLVENGRQIQVTWTYLPTTTWDAVSLPTGDGRRRSLGDSTSGKKLEDFFESRVQ